MPTIQNGVEASHLLTPIVSKTVVVLWWRSGSHLCAISPVAAWLVRLWICRGCELVGVVSQQVITIPARTFAAIVLLRTLFNFSHRLIDLLYEANFL